MRQPTYRMPRRSSGRDEPITPYAGSIHDHWHAAAARHGYRIQSRVRDHQHLALECLTCGTITVQRIFTMTDGRPLCQGCLERPWIEDARTAGVEWLRRDPDHRHYGYYRLPCGHEVRRQVTLIQSVARGATGIRCETCQEARDGAIAKANDWTLLGPSPSGKLGYRSYRHDLCGHEQEVSVGNMLTRRVGCGRCDPGWCAAPSYLYLLRITLPDGRRWAKLGMARDPESRVRHQLRLVPEVTCQIVHMVPFASGHAALRAEKPLHASLRRTFPSAVISRDDLAPWLSVVSEVYAGHLETEILTRLRALAPPS